MPNDSSPIGAFVLLMVMFALYFLPTFIAARRKHPNGTPIFLINLLLGWTAIGWIAALIWSASSIAKESVAQVGSAAKVEDKYEKLEKLASMKERGFISEQEYEVEKRKLLNS